MTSAGPTGASPPPEEGGAAVAGKAEGGGAAVAGKAEEGGAAVAGKAEGGGAAAAGKAEEGAAAAAGKGGGAGSDVARRRHPPGFWRARTLVIVASILLIFAIMATWIRAQIIDTDGWTQTSVRLLQNEKVREVVANDLSERVLAAANIQNLATEKLPKEFQALAPVLSTAALAGGAQSDRKGARSPRDPGTVGTRQPS